jgi:hypothetical protein
MTNSLLLVLRENARPAGHASEDYARPLRPVCEREAAQ